MNDKIGIVEFLENHLSYKYKIALTVLMVVSIGMGFNYIRDLRHNLAIARQEQATLQQQFHNLGESAVSHNEMQQQQSLSQQAQKAFGDSLTDYVKKTNSTIQSLTTALGVVAASVDRIKNQDQKTFTQSQNPTTGALQNYPIEDSRVGPDGKDLPSLGRINLSYDPSQKDPNKAFEGTTWTNYEEQFKASIGQWKSQKDGSFRTSLNFSRTVLKPDPTNPSHMIVEGTEPIQITGSDTIYSPKSFTATQAPLSRWTLMLGVSKDNVKYAPTAIASYRLLNNGAGLFAGTANNAVVFGVGFHIGH